MGHFAWPLNTRFALMCLVLLRSTKSTGTLENPVSLLPGMA
jgi:hypothetical protein